MTKKKSMLKLHFFFCKSIFNLENYKFAPLSKIDRDVAQSGSVRRSGRRGRRFKSCHPDQSGKNLKPVV